MSTKTGTPPKRWIALAVAKNVKLGQITSSPGSISIAIKANSNASLPDAQPIANSVSQISATDCWRDSTYGPPMNRPESMICETDSMISALRGELPRPTSSSGALVAGEQAVWQVFWLSADVSRLTNRFVCRTVANFMSLGQSRVCGYQRLVFDK